MVFEKSFLLLMGSRRKRIPNPTQSQTRREPPLSRLVKLTLNIQQWFKPLWLNEPNKGFLPPQMLSHVHSNTVFWQMLIILRMWFRVALKYFSVSTHMKHTSMTAIMVTCFSLYEHWGCFSGYTQEQPKISMQVIILIHCNILEHPRSSIRTTQGVEFMITFPCFLGLCIFALWFHTSPTWNLTPALIGPMRKDPHPGKQSFVSIPFLSWLVYLRSIQDRKLSNL